MPGEPGRDRGWYLVLGLILVLGLGLRLWGIDFGLPNLYCRPDENTLVHKAGGMGKGDLNPHFFNYPSLHFYVLAALYGLYFCAGYLGGTFAGLADFERQCLVDPSAVYLLGRLLGAGLGTASILLLYLIGQRAGGRRLGLVAGALLSVNFLHTRDSHFLTVDIPASFHLLVAYLLYFKYLQGGRWGELAWGAVFLGLAASTKYNLGIFVAAQALAVVLGPAGAARWRQLAGSLALTGLAFVAGTPFALLDWTSFWRDLSFERAHFAAGHAGLDLGWGWVRHLEFTLPLGLGWPLLLAGLGGCVWLGWRRRPADLVLLGGILAYYAVAGSGKVVFPRYMLPLVPLLCLSAAMGFEEVARRWRGLWVVLVLAALLPGFLFSWQHSQLLTRRDTRLLAAEWIEAQVPDRACIAMTGSEYGHPQVRRTRIWMQERLEDLRQAGQSVWYQERLLQMPGFPPTPAYYVVSLRPSAPMSLRSVWNHGSVDSLLSRGVGWVITLEHPLLYSQVDAELARQLESQAVLMARFDPFLVGEHPAPMYDPADAYYVPLAGFAALERPGPLIKIYRLGAGP
ncbi:MAG: glycosyltransferase family 39 protein [Candidatus Handelsmanbacteria bacterium]|nr:glycosyltransferase family 39 protein [Candidatus Handelsmanbacteria bacterium]